MKKILSLVLAFMLLLQCGTVAFAAEEQEEQPYTLTQMRVGEEALDVITDDAVNCYFTEIQEENDLTVVSATMKTVYVAETISANGDVSESHLMNEAEVVEYQNMVSTCSDNTYSVNGNTWIGEDEEEHQGGKLSIYLVVYKDSSGNYLAYGTADWENGVYWGGVNGPSSGYDFIAITWGGGGELKNTARSISGIYQYDQGDISFSRAESDTYYGYCWQFNEKTGSYYADYIDCYAKIAKTYTTVQSKETSIQLTYIHTYQSAVGSVSFEGGSSGAAAGVSLSSCDKQWQLEIDVPGITY